MRDMRFLLALPSAIALITQIPQRRASRRKPPLSARSENTGGRRCQAGEILRESHQDFLSPPRLPQFACVTELCQFAWLRIVLSGVAKVYWEPLAKFIERGEF